MHVTGKLARPSPFFSGTWLILDFGWWQDIEVCPAEIILQPLGQVTSLKKTWNFSQPLSSADFSRTAASAIGQGEACKEVWFLDLSSKDIVNVSMEIIRERRK